MLNSFAVSAKPYPGLIEYAPELVRSMMSLDEHKFPDELSDAITLSKSTSLVNVAALDPLPTCSILIEDFVYGQNAALSTRARALTILAACARKSCGRFESPVEQPQPEQDSASEKLGINTKTLARSLDNLKMQQAKVLTKNRFAPVASDIFSKLIHGLGRSHSSLNLADRDAQTLSQVMATLAVFISCAGPHSMDTRSLCVELLELSNAFRLHSNAIVRRASLICLSTISEALQQNDLISEFAKPSGADDSLMTWLSQSAESDPDDVCRGLSRTVFTGVVKKASSSASRLP